MDWVFDNLKLVIGAIVMVVWAIQSVRKKAEDGAPPPESPRQQQVDAEEAERTRQIQEEIRRKILARQRGEQPQVVPTPPPLVVIQSREVEEPEYLGEGPATPPPLPRKSHADEFPSAPPDMVTQEAAAAAAVYERQHALGEQLRQLRAAREAAPAGAPAFPQAAAHSNAASVFVASGALTASSICGELRNRHAMRRAMILREILSEPVALRRK